jgi:hypothetical protein
VKVFVKGEGWERKNCNAREEESLGQLLNTIQKGNRMAKQKLD